MGAVHLSSQNQFSTTPVPCEEPLGPTCCAGTALKRRSRAAGLVRSAVAPVVGATHLPVDCVSPAAAVTPTKDMMAGPLHLLSPAPKTKMFAEPSALMLIAAGNQVRASGLGQKSFEQLVGQRGVCETHAVAMPGGGPLAG